MLTDRQIEEFEEASKPLMKWLCENCNPHTKVIVDSICSEVLSGEAVFNTEQFLVD